MIKNMDVHHSEDFSSSHKNDRVDCLEKALGQPEQDENTNQIFTEENRLFTDENDLQELDKDSQGKQNRQRKRNFADTSDKDDDSKCHCSCLSVNTTMLIYKGFFFFFYAAVGSLIPFLSVFYKQLWLSAKQTGILLGIGPLIKMVAIPMWGVVADFYKKSKFIFIFSLVAWLVAYYSISLVSPVFHVGYCQDNSSMSLAEDILNDLIAKNSPNPSPISSHRIQPTTKRNSENTSFSEILETDKKVSQSGGVQNVIKRRTLPSYGRNNKMVVNENFGAGQSNNMEFKNNSFFIWNRKIVTRSVSTEIEKNKNKNGNKFNAYLRELSHKLRKSDKFKSEFVSKILSIAESRANSSEGLNSSEITSIFTREQLERIFDYLNMQGHYPWPLDTIVDYKETQESNEWQKNQNSHMFTVLFVITAVGTLLSSPSSTLADIATLQQLGDSREDYGKQRLWGSFGWGLGAFVIGACISTIQELNNCNNPLNVDYMPCFYSFAILMGIAILIGFLFEFDDAKHESESFLKGFSSILCDCTYIYFMLTMLFCGCATGIIQTFLLWHLQDIGGSQFLFSCIISLQCLSEVFMYFISGNMILFFGHHRVLYAGLICYAIRFFGYAFITNSWLVLPLELLHGLTSAAVWSAGVVFVGLIPGATTTMQGILGGVYFGLGNGGGGMVGGIIVSLIGCPYTFLLLGVISIVDLFLFVLVNNCSAMHCTRKKTEDDSESPNAEYTLLKDELHSAE